MLRVGLTGGIGSGKSTAAQILHDLGAAVVDADRLVADLYAPGAAGAAAVERLFGRDLLLPGGAVSKPALARLAFEDPDARRRLEAAVHPLVVEEIRRRFAAAERAGAHVAVAEASQLLEGGHSGDFDRVLLVVAPHAARLDRAESRGLDRPAVERRMAAQMSEDEARARADEVVENSGTVDELREKLARIYRGWVRD